MLRPTRSPCSAQLPTYWTASLHSTQLPPAQETSVPVSPAPSGHRVAFRLFRDNQSRATLRQEDERAGAGRGGGAAGDLVTRRACRFAAHLQEDLEELVCLLGCYGELLLDPGVCLCRLEAARQADLA
jgi:hypothetical protein